MDKIRCATAIFAASLGNFAIASELGIGDPAPPIKVAKWVQGIPVKNGVGGLRVVEFWATWCPPCRESIPHLTALSKKYQGKVTFTGVDVSEGSPDDVQTVTTFLKKMGSQMTYNVAVDDKEGTMGRTWMLAAHQDGIPTAFVVNKAGSVVWIGQPTQGLDKVLSQLIAGTFDLKKSKADFAAMVTAEAAQSKAQTTLEAQQEAFNHEVEGAIATYKAGKKTEALSLLDKIAAAHPQAEIKRGLNVLRFQMILDDDKAGANAIVEAEVKVAGKQAPYAYLQFGQMAIEPHPNPASPADLSFALGLADKALAIGPTDPMVEFEAALIYSQNSNLPKAISLSQDALKNIDQAPPEFRDKLKTTITQKLTEFQARKS